MNKSIIHIKYLFFLFLIFLTSTVFAEEKKPVRVYENGYSQINFKNEPYEKSGIVYIPLREFAERNNAVVIYKQPEITVIYNSSFINLIAGKDSAIYNGNEISLSANIENINGVTYIGVEDSKYIGGRYLYCVEYEIGNDGIKNAYLRWSDWTSKQQNFEKVDYTFSLELLNEIKGSGVVSPTGFQDTLLVLLKNVNEETKTKLLSFLKQKDINEYLEKDKLENGEYFLSDVVINNDINKNEWELLNNVSLHSPWTYVFSEDDNCIDKFYFRNNSMEDVTYMRRTSVYEYYEESGVKALSMSFRTPEKKELPYEMTFIISKDGLNNEVINRIYRYKDRCMVNVQLPKFELNSTISFKEYLEKKGVSDIFVQNNGSKTNVENDHKFIRDLLQTSNIQVQENGISTKTIVETDGFLAELQKVLAFSVNESFYFLVTDTRNDNVLFIGKFGY